MCPHVSYNFNLMPDKLNWYEYKLSVPTATTWLPPHMSTAFVTIMVLISQESYSFNLLSRLYYYRNLQNNQYLQKHQSIYNSVIL